MNVGKFIERTCYEKECLDLMLFYTNLEVPNHLEEFQDLVKSLEVNPIELGGVKD